MRRTLACLSHWVQTWKQTSINGAFTCELFAFSSFPRLPSCFTFTPDSTVACCDVSHSSCADIHDNGTASYQLHSCREMGKITKRGIKSDLTTTVDHPGVLTAFSSYLKLESFNIRTDGWFTNPKQLWLASFAKVTRG